MLVGIQIGSLFLTRAGCHLTNRFGGSEDSEIALLSASVESSAISFLGNDWSATVPVAAFKNQAGLGFDHCKRDARAPVSSRVTSVTLQPQFRSNQLLISTQSGGLTMANRITVEDLRDRLDRGGDIFFVDTRNPTAWAEAETKLPGAIRVPADQVEQHLADIPRDRTVVTYCT